MHVSPTNFRARDDAQNPNYSYARDEGIRLASGNDQSGRPHISWRTTSTFDEGSGKYTGTVKLYQRYALMETSKVEIRWLAQEYWESQPSCPC